MKYISIYSYFETEKSMFNLAYFIKKALYNNNEIDYVFVINSDKCSVNIPEQSNIKIINRDNLGRDFAAWSEALKIINKDEYDYYIFINDTVIGPFLPRYIKTEWYKLFCNLINDKFKLSGLTINYKPFDNTYNYTHVQSMMYCIDKIGLIILIDNYILMDNKYDKYDKYEYILKYEIGMSQIIIENGYKITALALSENKRHSINDIWQRKNLYFDNNINPLETIFYKNNRYESDIYIQYLCNFF